ncbi:MAG TPA: amidohydrolase family protein [Planctomycetaceae bacterium]
MSDPPRIKLAEFDAQRVSLRARWVFSGCGPPLENATVEITAGRVSAIHNRCDRPSCDLGNAAIIPGLVNAHTHLELSDVTAPLPPASSLKKGTVPLGKIDLLRRNHSLERDSPLFQQAAAPFTDWLKAVMAHRQNRAANVAADDQAVMAGLSESARHGTTTIGDIAARSASRTPAGTHSRMRTVAFLEILGLAPERIAPQLRRAHEYLAGDATVIRGISPHAPYSVHPDLLSGLTDMAVKYRAPLAMHLAETRSELELLATGGGEFVPFLQELGVWRDDAIPRGSRPLDYLRELARAERALAIHGNYFDDEEIEFVAAHSNISVVYCPRTHAYFQQAPHPWRKLLSRGVNLALGTDSRASNPDLSLFGEMQFLRKLTPDLDPAHLLQLGTSNGARALGVDDETGTLAVGKSADLAIVSLPESNRNDPCSLLFDPASRIVDLPPVEQ